ncbi:MAG: hypothetical protein GIX03_05725 [Candidatus Eremiobacteraeota bacterium]|nr:hypothetical protein [Candidatus Eremiobacteraeota bacterium]
MHPTLARLNAPVGSRLAHVYQTPWLRLPYRVDVVNSASWEGSFANAADGYFQIVTSSGDKENSGPVAVDLLYHEASHSVVEPSRGTIGRAISRAAQAADKPEPSELWHALIFYTPSTIIRTLVEQSESRPYRGYPEIAGLSTRVWPRYFAAFARYWQPYVEGRGTLQGALTSVVNSVYQTVVPRTGGLRSSLAQFG